MALNVENIKTKALNADLSAMEQGAAAAGADPQATKEKVTKEIAEIVKKALEALPLVVRWLVDDKWAAKLTQMLVNLFGEKLLDLLK